MPPPRFARQGHPPVHSGRVGVLLVNLGTPEATDYWSMRRYLAEFLSDRRVIETPRWLWWLILNLFILPRRPAAKGRDYDSIWNRERNEGPLKTFTRSQAEKLAAGARRRRADRSRLGDALRPAGDRRAPRRAAGQGLRPHPARAALSAILRGDERDGRRQGVRGAAGDALAADAARRRALVRRSRLYRRARALDPRFARRARLRARSPARLVPRHPARLFRPGRSLLLPLRQDDAAAARRARARAKIGCA